MLFRSEGIDVIPERWRTRNVVEFLLWVTNESQQTIVKVQFHDRIPHAAETLVVWLTSKSSEYFLWKQYRTIDIDLAQAKFEVRKAIIEVATRETPGIIYDPPQAFIG